ncbi:MAG: prolyl oligopeptidase family serine peptidase, partial [Bacteroidota bacterium]
MNRNIILSCILFLVIARPGIFANEPADTPGGYTLVVEGFDWGAGASKVILPMGKTVSGAQAGDYTVTVQRKSSCTDLAAERASGNIPVLYAYVSDAKGHNLPQGDHTTLVLLVGPAFAISSPMEYVRTAQCPGNHWVDYSLTISEKPGKRIWDKETGRIRPIVDDFDLSGRFVYDEKLTMSYASYTPETQHTKSPLIIWLHGGGEGGFDPTIPLMANRAANYASREIQAIFEGAYVLVPQCPGAWMHNKEGVMTPGRDNDVYNAGLMALIKDYVASNPAVDTDRIYVGGYSNGGYMSLKLILLYPDYFAAGFISSLAYYSQYISDEQIESIKEVPIWFVHSADDGTTVPEETVLPVYKRLMEAGAKNIHLSYYDRVVDIT